MTNLKRILSLACLGALLAPAPARAAGAPDLNIGFVGTLSGAGAYQAQDQLDGFKLGVKHLGGRIGGAEFDLTVLDDRHDASAAAQAVSRLLREERVQVVLLSSEPRATALAAPLATAGKSFVISLNAPAPDLAGKECSPYFFSLSGLSETMHDVSGQYLQAQGYKSIAVVGPDTAAEHVAVEALRHGFKGSVTEVLSGRGQMDFARDLQTIRGVGPDALYLLHSGGMAVNFIRQFGESPLKGVVPLFGPGAVLDQTILAASGAAALDLFSVGPWSDDSDAPANKRLVSDFESEYARPPSLYAAEGYDAAMLLDATIRSIDKKFNDDDAMRGALRRVEFPSTRGSLRFDTNHFPIQSYVLRQAVKDARGHFASEQRGQLVRDARDGHAGECPMRWVAEPPPKAQP